MKDITIDKLSPEQALEILKRMGRNDPKTKKQIQKEAKELLREIDVEEICEGVYGALDGIEVEDLWARSGPSRHGYSGPEDMAAEMIEEEIEPFIAEILKYLEIGMTNEAKVYCMGVLKGIYRYEHESRSEFRDWATDIPAECFGHLLLEWKKKVGNDNSLNEIREFVEKECSMWARRASKI
jgi:hypothetical protein